MKHKTTRLMALALALVGSTLTQAAPQEEAAASAPCKGPSFTNVERHVQSLFRFCKAEAGDEIRATAGDKIENLLSLHTDHEMWALVAAAGYDTSYCDAEKNVEVLSPRLGLINLDLLSTTLRRWKSAEDSLAILPPNLIIFFEEFGAYYSRLAFTKPLSESGDSAYAHLLQQAYQPFLGIQTSGAPEDKEEQDARIDFVLTQPLYSLDTPEGHGFSIKAAHWAFTDFHGDPKLARDCLEWVRVFTNFTSEPFAEIESAWTSIYTEISSFMVRKLDEDPSFRSESSSLQAAYQELVNHDADEESGTYTVPVENLLDALKGYIGEERIFTPPASEEDASTW